MLSKVKQILLRGKEYCKGFTLIEALVSSAVFGIGFVGVYTIVAVSEQIMVKSAQKQKVQMIADQMLDIMATDTANIDSYGMDLSACTVPVTTDQWDVRGYEWCIRLNSEIGPVTANDDRSITIGSITDVTDPRLGLRTVTILLEGNNEKVQIVMKRTFDD